MSDVKPLTAKEAKALEPLFMDAAEELRALIERAGEEVGGKINDAARPLGILDTPERSEHVGASWLRGWQGQPARTSDDKRAHALGKKSLRRFMRPDRKPR